MAQRPRRTLTRHHARLVLVGPQGHAFEVRRGRHLLGRLLVRNGSLVWWPSRTKDYSYRITWPGFDLAAYELNYGWQRRKGRWDLRTILPQVGLTERCAVSQMA